MLQKLKDHLIALGYSRVEATYTNSGTQICKLEIYPANLRTANGNWPALVSINAAGLVPSDVREFGGALLIEGVNIEAMGALPAIAKAEIAEEPVIDLKPADDTPPVEPPPEPAPPAPEPVKAKKGKGKK